MRCPILASPITLALALLLTGCAPPASRPPVLTADVTASGETTAVATQDADAADDPAIWRNAADPAASLIVGTDKKAGLYVYGLDGSVRDFINAGRVNNVDLAETPAGIIVVASDRNDNDNAHLALFRLDPVTARLTAIGRVPAGAGEAYGVCLFAAPYALHAFIVLKDGTIRQIALDAATGTGRTVRTMKLPSQSEGCVVDARTARLYAAEEDAGLWRFDALPQGSTTPVRIASTDGARLVADAEGLAIAATGAGNGGWLIASSQGDNAYAVWRLSDDRYMGRFRIAAGRYGATQETDGIEVKTGNFGPAFPAGIMIAQDGNNAPKAQNFKLVRWDAVQKTLKLPG
ncbi:phytase [Sandarakinorhabdus sp.]|uniref:phytase n=1 Tax=Sandarakinorhabdus sp. TaxID=1916663 RepID=UPI00286D6E21|nr:phytase [Sandarakinorhabdus sp.]